MAAAGTSRRRRPDASNPTRSCSARSTTTASPQTRYVLARGADERGFAFFTNYDSAKSHQLDGVGRRRALLFTWLQLHRQVRVVGARASGCRPRRATRTSPRGRARRRSARGRRRSRRCCRRATVLDERVRELESTFADVRADPAPGALGRLADPADDVRVLAGPPEPAPRPRPLPPRRPARRASGWLIERLAALSRRRQCRAASVVAASTRPSISAWVCGAGPGPSQSQNSGVVPRTRGGSSICTPC